jgi:eukaryotic-like serine/threonine-protein kinase
MNELIGRSLNRYRLEELIGEGGIGAVYRAHDTVLQRDVAIKVLRPEFEQHDNFRQRFLQEARTAARLDHPGIVRVHDFGQDGDWLYIVMEYIQGDNLRQMLQNLRAQNKWIVLPEAVGIVQQVCIALDYVHQQGVVHRDIKPDNLMLKPEPGNGLPYRVVVTDLGLARLIEEEELIDHGVSMGTPGYMSPEQARGEETGPQSEVYSLGILLYELSVGRLPFPAKSISEAVRYHREEPIPAPRSLRPDLPIALEQVIMKALDKDPGARYANVDELSEALEEAMPVVDEAAFTPESIEDTVSLVTQYDLSSPASGGTTQAMLPEDRQDYLQVLLPDKTVRMVQITADEMNIGRDEGNQIVLDNPKISRSHARIQYDGQRYWVTDLNSRNGSFLGGNRLVGGDPAAWEGDQPLQVGDVFLRLKRGSMPAVYQAEVDDTQPNVTQVEENIVRSGSSSRRVGLFMETIHISVAPGSASTARFILLNRGPVVDQFRILVEGIPSTWITPPSVIQLPPGGQQEVRLDIQPPQTPQSRPGRYPVTIRVSSQEDPDQTAEVKATLTVGVFSRFTSEMRPRRVSPDQTVQITVHNQGNSQDTYIVDMADQGDLLVFHPAQARLTLAEGEMASADFLIAPKQRRWIGGSRTEAFSARIRSSGGEVRNHSGEMENVGIIPPVVIPLLLVLCLCLSALAAYGILDPLGTPARAQQTAAAETQIAAATQAALALANQATIEAATAEAATIQAATAIIAATQTIEAFIAETLTAMPPTPTIETPPPTEIPTPIIIVVTPTPEPETPTPEPPTPTPTLPATPTPPALPTPTPITILPTPTPLGGSMLVEFSSSRDGLYEIYAMLPDGRQQTRVTNNTFNDTSPSLSPDSSRLVFVSDRDGRRQIYGMNADGSGQVRLTQNEFEDYNPAWSPDGTRIAFTSTRDGNPEIYVMNIDGTAQTRLTNDPAIDDHPAWSPDSSRIVFDRGTDENRAILIMNANGTGITALTDGTFFDFDPSWSPDGARIAFSSNRGGGFDIYLMDANGANITRLTNFPDPTAGPVWSRDGNWIAFYTTTPTLGEIYVVRIDGAQLTNLTNNQIDDIHPTW